MAQHVPKSARPYNCNLLYFSLPLSNPSAQCELFIRTPFHNYKNEMSFLKILIDYSIISNWPKGYSAFTFFYFRVNQGSQNLHTKIGFM